MHKRLERLQMLGGLIALFGLFFLAASLHKIRDGTHGIDLETMTQIIGFFALGLLLMYAGWKMNYVAKRKQDESNFLVTMAGLALAPSNYVCARCKKALIGDDLAYAQKCDVVARSFFGDVYRPGMPAEIIKVWYLHNKTYYCQLCLDHNSILHWAYPDKKCSNCLSFVCNFARMEGVPDLYCMAHDNQAIENPFKDRCASWQLGRPFNRTDQPALAMVDVNAKDVLSGIALRDALQFGHPEVVQLLEKAGAGSIPGDQAEDNETICKAHKNGRCISQQTGADTGPCTWRPADWQNCAVVDENKRFYGKW